jgi:lipopolysaccharide transport system permease protein
VSSVAEAASAKRDCAEVTCLDGSPSEADGLPVTIIRRRSGWGFIDFREIWRYRDLLFFLTWRDVKVRYKQTVLGAAWAVLQPLATMAVFAVFLGRVAGISTTAYPYSLFVLAGVLPWMLFANGITAAGQSIVGSQSLVTKVYFPRVLIPMGAIGAGLVDFAIAFGLLVAMMLWFGVLPGFAILLIPLLVLGLLLATLAVGILLSALTVAYRDFRHLIPFMVQLWMFATPCIYLPTEMMLDLPGQGWLSLNPVYGFIVNVRQAVLGGTLDMQSLAASAGVSLVLLLLGCLYFRRVERSFADII